MTLTDHLLAMTEALKTLCCVQLLVSEGWTATFGPSFTLACLVSCGHELTHSLKVLLCELCMRVRRNKLDGPYDNRVMPIVLSATLIVALSITFGSSIVAYEHDS